MALELCLSVTKLRTNSIRNVRLFTLKQKGQPNRILETLFRHYSKK